MAKIGPAIYVWDWWQRGTYERRRLKLGEQTPLTKTKYFGWLHKEYVSCQTGEQTIGGAAKISFDLKIETVNYLQSVRMKHVTISCLPSLALAVLCSLHIAFSFPSLLCLETENSSVLVNIFMARILNIITYVHCNFGFFCFFSSSSLIFSANSLRALAALISAGKKRCQIGCCENLVATIVVSSILIPLSFNALASLSLSSDAHSKFPRPISFSICSSICLCK
jgi:hypothetical protein